MSTWVRHHCFPVPRGPRAGRLVADCFVEVLVGKARDESLRARTVQGQGSEHLGPAGELKALDPRFAAKPPRGQ
eukprot:12553704-Alexandrium_andersonii.AAC.1